MTIKEAQQRVDAWIKEYGVRYFNELTNMAILTEEVGEVARIMARTYGEQSFKEGDKSDLADEIADAKFVKIDTDQNQEIAAEYGVMSIPTLVVIKDGKEVKRSVGMVSKQDVLKLLA